MDGGSSRREGTGSRRRSTLFSSFRLRRPSILESKQGGKGVLHGHFGSLESTKYMLPAASTWLPITFLKFIVLFNFAFIFAVAALDIVGDWATDAKTEIRTADCRDVYDSFESAQCSGVNFAGGEMVSHTFTGLYPLNRWLRVSLDMYTVSARLVPENATLTLHVRMFERNSAAEGWSLVYAAPTQKQLWCPHRALTHATPCNLFNVAFKEGLSSRQYRVDVQLARHSVVESRAWARGTVLKASHGRRSLGEIDMAMRTIGAVVALLALFGFLYSMWSFPSHLWLPQQRMVLVYLGLLFLYNDPTIAISHLAGGRNYFYQMVLAALFVAGGAVLALVLLDVRSTEHDGIGAADDRTRPELTHAMRAGSSLGGSDKLAPTRESRALPAAAGAAEQESPLEELSQSAFERLSGSPISSHAFWLPKLALAAALFVITVTLDSHLYAVMQQDPGVTYSSLPSYRAYFGLEAAVSFTWLGYAVYLGLVGVGQASKEYHRLRHDAERGVLDLTFTNVAHVMASKAYLATATALVMVILAIHLREGVRTRASDHPTYSDSAFRTALQNVVVANVLGIGLAVCFQPSATTKQIRNAGGLQASLEHGLGGLDELTSALHSYSQHLKKRVGKSLHNIHGAKPGAEQHAAAVDGASDAGGARCDSSRSASRGGAGSSSARAGTIASQLGEARTEEDGVKLLAKLLKEYAADMKLAWEKGGDENLAEERVEELRMRQTALERLPHIARHVAHIKWRYPVLYTSRQRYVWALVVRDVDDSEHREYWARVLGTGLIPAVRQSALGASVGAPVAALCAHLESLGLTPVRKPVRLAANSPHVLILLGATEAVREEHLRYHRWRCSVELELPTTPPEPITAADKLMAIARLLGDNPVSTEQSHAGLRPGMMSLKVGGFELVADSFPLHDRALNATLHTELRRLYVLNDEQLTVLRNHYGEEVGFYYAVLNFTCTWLTPMAGLGVLFGLLRYSDARELYESFYIAFASISVLWGALVYVFWRRHANSLALQWGVSELHEKESPNPAFVGRVVDDHVYGGVRRDVSGWTRWPAYLHTLWHMLIQVLVLIVLEYCVYAHWVWLNESLDNPQTSIYYYYFHSSFVNSLLYIVLIMYGQYVVWSYVAHWCTGKENWAYMRQFSRNYVSYVFLFIWLDGYMWSLIIGLVHIPTVEWYQSNDGDLTEVNFPIFGRLFKSNDHDADYWMQKHTDTIILMLSTNQIAGLFAENVFPVLFVYFVHRTLRKQRRYEADERAAGRGTADNMFDPAGGGSRSELDKLVQQAKEEWWLWEYSTQDDYYDVVLFIGYIATYTVIWPVTPLMSWVNNHIELRTDLIKINRAWRRKVPMRVPGIGAWEQALGISVLLSIVLVVAFGTISTRTAETFFRTFENPAHPQHETFWNPKTGHVWIAYRFVVLFAWEHVLGVLVFAIIFFIPPWTTRLRAHKYLQQKDRLQSEARHDEGAPAADRTPRAKGSGGNPGQSGSGGVTTSACHSASAGSTRNRKAGSADPKAAGAAAATASVDTGGRFGFRQYF